MYFIASAAPGVNATPECYTRPWSHFAVGAMSHSSSPLAVIGAIVAAGLSLFLALQAAALLLPFVLSSSYRWVLAPIAILLLVLGGLQRARGRRKASLRVH